MTAFADVALHVMRVLASCPRHGAEPREPSYADWTRPQRRAAVRVGLALEQIPQRGLQRPSANPPNVCTRMSSRLQKLSTVPLHELDAVMCTDLGVSLVAVNGSLWSNYLAHIGRPGRSPAAV